MNGIAFMLPIALGMGLFGLAAFFWALRRGQFSDLDGAAARILIEEEDHYQLYGEVNFELTDTVEFHGEAMWASHDVPQENSSPSYAPVTGPTTGRTSIPSAQFCTRC